MGVQTESSLEQWLQAYVEEKGGPPRNALQICAFARNRGASLKYREVCDALDTLAHSKALQDPEKSKASSCLPPNWLLQSETAGAGDGQRSAATGKEARFRCDSPERQLHPAKLRFTWMLQLGGSAPTKVELLYSRRTGKKQVLIDGKAMFKTFTQTFEWTWQHPDNEVQIFLYSDYDHHELFCEGSCETSAEQRAPRISDGTCDSRLDDTRHSLDGPVRRDIPITPRADRFSCVAGASSSASSSTAKPAEEAKVDDRTSCERAQQEVVRDVRHVGGSPYSSSRGSELEVLRSIDSNATTAVPESWRKNCQIGLVCQGPLGVLWNRGDESYTTTEAFGSEVSNIGSSIESWRPMPSPRAAIDKPFQVLRNSSSAPELHFAYASAASHTSPLVPRLALDLVGTPSEFMTGMASVEAASRPAHETSPLQAMPEWRDVVMDSPVITTQFRQSRSTPIFNKVKEYLSASRASVPSKRAVIPTAQAQTGTVKKTVSSIEAHSPASTSAKSSKMVTPTSPVSSVVSPNSPGAELRRMREHIREHGKIQSVAAVVRARLSTSLSPTQRPTMAGVLEPLPEEVSHGDSRRRACTAAGARHPVNQTRTLVRNSSAPGDISNAEEMLQLQNKVKCAGSFGSNAVGKVAAKAQAKQISSEGSPNPKPVVPKLQLSEVIKSRFDSDGRRNSMPSSLQPQPPHDDGATPSLAQRSVLQMAQAQQQQRFPKKSRVMQWTPRGSSPTRVNVTTPDPGRSATPSHNILSSRHPPLLHGTIPSSQTWSFAPSHSPLSPSSASTQVSPTRARISGQSHSGPACGYPAGPSLARALFSQIQPSSSMQVAQQSCFVAPTMHAHPADSSGARSVGVPLPAHEFALTQLHGAGSYTPPVPRKQAGHAEVGLVSTATPLIQRRVRRSG